MVTDMTSSAMSRGELRRSSILDASIRVIAAEGVRAVTHRRVAAEADASVGLITYYFDTTDALIAATLDAVGSEEAKHLHALEERITSSGGDITKITELLVAEVRERSQGRRDLVLAGLALTLEIPRLTIDRVGFGNWENASEQVCEAILVALGHAPEQELIDFLEAALDGLYMFAVISKFPERVVDATRVGLAQLFRALGSPEATLSWPAEGEAGKES